MGFPANNTYVPAAQANLQVNFTRNPDAFNLNRYVTLAPVTKPNGYYVVHSRDEDSRLSNLLDADWADGAYAPKNHLKGHSHTEYATKRRAYGFTIGDIASDTADWDVISDHASGAASRLMTLTTNLVLTELTTAGNFTGATATATVASGSGGKWDASSASNLYIKKSLQYAVAKIVQATNGMVRASDLVLIIDPTTAHAISSNAEIHAYLSGSPDALRFMGGRNFAYGLPDSLYGIEVVVEDAVYNSAKKNATRSASFMVADSAVIVSRPGGIVGTLNTMSSVTLAMYEEMQVAIKHDDFNRLTEGVVYNNFATIIRPESSYLLTDVLS